jgi:hypothetical protein
MPCVLFTQLIELNFRELLDLTLTKVVIGYITRKLYITSFVKINNFWAILTSFFDKNNEFFDKITSSLKKMTFKTCYIMEIMIKLVL